jgi:hypothetical protein
MDDEWPLQKSELRGMLISVDDSGKLIWGTVVSFQGQKGHWLPIISNP